MPSFIHVEAKRALGVSLAALVALLAACAAPNVGVEPVAPPRVAPTPVETDLPEILVPVETCGETEADFEVWLASFRRYALTQGISKETVAIGLADVTYDPKIVELDRTQRPQKVPFETFVASHVTTARLRRGKQRLGAQAALLGKIEKRYGVAPEIVVALWGLETDFGEYQGSTRSLDALATLAHDCRRAEMFRGELVSALRILDRGDLALHEMRGAWAGELGQTQFLPSSYEKFGVDFDEDGRIDLVSSTEDALGSTANFLAGHGWQPRGPYTPDSPNFEVLAAWNRSDVYRRTIVVFAARLAGKKR